jgi:predicted permease
MLTPFMHALRVLRKDPGFTAVAICSMALGIGATAAGFSFAEATLLRPLPVENPDRVVAINTAKSKLFGNNSTISYPDYADVRDRSRSFDGLVAASYAKFGFSPDARTLPHMRFGLFVSGNLFRVMGVRPVAGRVFRPDEDQVPGRDAVVMLGHDFWLSQYNGNPSVVGSMIRLNGIDFTIIGVLPEHFTGIDTVFRPTLFVPLAMAPRMMAQNSLADREAGWLIVKGRLKPAVSVAQARREVEAISAGLQKLHAHMNNDRLLTVQTELELRMEEAKSVISMSVMLSVMGLCVLLVACANVAGLLLSRARARSREIAVRLAIGASRAALIRQLLLENLFVAIAGGVGGVALSDAIGEYWHRVPIPWDVPISFDAGVDRRVLLFTLSVSLLSTLVFGLVPAFRATRLDLVPALKAADADSGGKRRTWGRNLIVSVQVALSLVLLVVAAAMQQGFRDQLLAGPGFRTDHLFLTSFDTRLANYSDDRAGRFYEELLRRTRSAPGVRSAVLVSNVPMAGVENIEMVVEGSKTARSEKGLAGYGAYVSEGYFATMDTAILAGRGFLESDNDKAPLVAVVNEFAAQHRWPAGKAIGSRFHLGDSGGPLIQIVGIARMSKTLWIAQPPLDFVYLPYRQHARPAMSLVAESTANDAGTLAPVLRDVVRGLDPDMPVFDVRTMKNFYTQRAVITSGMITQIVEALGVTGLILALVGLYGLVAYTVSRRTREIGIRMAVGADRQQVVWMVLRQGLNLGFAGIAVGLVASYFACRLFTASLIFVGFEALNPLTYVLLPSLLLVVTMLAAWAPARRASLVDPMRALRDE